MADYINKNILSEAYVHIAVVDLSEQEKEKFEKSLMAFTESRGKFAIYENIIPEIRTRDGSLKVYSSITGTLTEALGDYPTFDEALDNLYIDAKRLAEAMILETLFLTKARGKAVMRREARTGIVHSTKELFDYIELTRSRAEEDSPKAAVKRLIQFKLKLAKLLEVLGSKDDKDLIKREASIKIKTLMIPRRIKESRLPNDLLMYEAERVSLMNTLKNVAE